MQSPHRLYENGKSRQQRPTCMLKELSRVTGRDKIVRREDLPGSVARTYKTLDSKRPLFTLDPVLRFGGTKRWVFCLRLLSDRWKPGKTQTKSQGMGKFLFDRVKRGLN